MWRRLVGLLSVSLLLGAGCSGMQDQERLNAPPQGESYARSNVAEYFAYHNDQGMMADMSIADIHFVPHSAELSGTGEARLERYAELLATTGGTLNYLTTLTDKKLIDTRLKTAKKFLESAIAGNQCIEVVLGLPGGRGMDAKKALAAQEVAMQPEPRENAYHLSDKTGVREEGN